jgi:predicted phosphoadenosine phosphosulfate sulfurtransferase
MSGRTKTGTDVFTAALERLLEQYSAGHRVVVAFSSGKDSTCVLELACIAARMTDRLPVEAVIRDEEILLPGSYEYADRIHQRDDIRLHHLVANQPIINAFNRAEPYWWVFDPLLDPDDWVRQPPPYAEHIPEINIEAMITKQRFPIDETAGQHLLSAQGLRVQESRGRMYGLFSSGGYMTKPHHLTGVYGCRPIYDWKDGDVWRAIQTNGWDYNGAYNTMFRHGIPPHRLRIGPPSMNVHSVEELRYASQAWPQWWDRVCRRLPGMRQAAMFGTRVVKADRRAGESWQVTFERECVEKAPEWIAERAVKARDRMLSSHARHATTPLPERESCRTCSGNLGSWMGLTRALYGGDPFSMKATILPYVDPERFRPGAGNWNGHPG